MKQLCPAAAPAPPAVPAADWFAASLLAAHWSAAPPKTKPFCKQTFS